LLISFGSNLPDAPAMSINMDLLGLDGLEGLYETDTRE
jgi:hypothetical protein